MRKFVATILRQGHPNSREADSSLGPNKGKIPQLQSIVRHQRVHPFEGSQLQVLGSAVVPVLKEDIEFGWLCLVLEK